MSCGGAVGACQRAPGREAMRVAGTTRSWDARGRSERRGDARQCRGALGVERLTVADEGLLESHSAAMRDGPLKAAANVRRQWRAARSDASPLHAGVGRRCGDEPGWNGPGLLGRTFGRSAGPLNETAAGTGQDCGALVEPVETEEREPARVDDSRLRIESVVAAVSAE